MIPLVLCVVCRANSAASPSSNSMYALDRDQEFPNMRPKDGVQLHLNRSTEVKVLPLVPTRDILDSFCEGSLHPQVENVWLRCVYFFG